MSLSVVIDPFCFRQFRHGGSPYIAYDMQEFLNRINSLYNPAELKPGYDYFCKHMFVENFTDTKIGAMEITDSNKHLLQSAYEARTEKELPVLARWFPKESFAEVPKAKYLDIILYSYQQIQAENQARGEVDPVKEPYEWGIVGIKAQDEPHESPMQPITVMRNALGKEEGGSGVPMNRQKYLESVAYWSTHALIK
jgi:hypothetical protein